MTEQIAEQMTEQIAEQMTEQMTKKARRQATIQRKTTETSVAVTLNLDGQGKYDIHSEIGFLDHMLEQLTRHGLLDMRLRAKGDLHIDAHHLVEDCGLALGAALAKALGDCRGIRRYGAALIPMDEALTRVVVDISKRPILVWRVRLHHAKIGTFDSELLREWFHAFAMAAQISLHVETFYGENDHHIAESCYKALARALREAIAIDPKMARDLPSTKEHLGL